MKQQSVRIGDELVKRADALIEPIGQRPENQFIPKLKRSNVLAMAVVRGIEVLEAEVKQQAKRKYLTKRAVTSRDA